MDYKIKYTLILNKLCYIFGIVPHALLGIQSNTSTILHCRMPVLYKNFHFISIQLDPWSSGAMMPLYISFQQKTRVKR